MTWAQRLKRVFNIDVETCGECGGDVRIIASIEDPAVIKKIEFVTDKSVVLSEIGQTELISAVVLDSKG